MFAHLPFPPQTGLKIAVMDRRGPLDCAQPQALKKDTKWPRMD
ncbi:hypothetical protein CSIRO_0627 [Bradyrhizobiaceae bacterium SG-6C]|nr:hypothetical protein CSIRO_0627 [Bradyrhizobiaceae bacterium SG-6C]